MNKHKMLFFIFVFLSLIFINKIDSKAATEYYFNVTEIYTGSNAPYYLQNTTFSTDYKIAFVYAGKHAQDPNNGYNEIVDKYYPIIDLENNVEINCQLDVTYYRSDMSINNGTSFSKSIYFYSLNYIRSGSNVKFINSSWQPLETNIPIFSTLEQAENFFLNGDTTGQINKPLECIYDESIETPVVHFPNFSKDNIDYTCYITNSTDKYNIEVQGRCHTFNDIELYKDKIYFKTREYTKLKNELTTWITYEDSIQSKGQHDFAVYAKNSFDNLLSLYPIDSRNIFGGKNSVGDFFSGYSVVLGQVKDDLANIRSHFNIIEFYIRFYYIENNVVHYGKWCHVYNFVTEKDNLIYQSNIGIDDDEKNSLENSSDSLIDNNASTNLSQSEINSLNDDSLWNVIKNIVAGLGDFPELVRSVFSFMPDWLFSILAFGISFIVILRFLGR